MSQNSAGHVNEWNWSLSCVWDSWDWWGLANQMPKPCFKGPALFSSSCLLLCKNARPGLPAPQIFMKSRFSWETFSFLNIKNWFQKKKKIKHFCRWISSTSYQVATSSILETSAISIIASLWRLKPPDFPTCRLIGPAKSIEYHWSRTWFAPPQ